MNFPELRLVYYRRLFPTHSVVQWLTQLSDLKNREFAFVLNNSELFVRWVGFEDAKELLSYLIQNNPSKINVGAVYNAPVSLKNKTSFFHPISREFILDIDISAYDDVRTCCKKESMCSKCWPFIQAAVHVLDTALEKDFGFKYRLWVYSGRRGVHCWTFDFKACQLKNNARQAAVQFMSLDRKKDIEVQNGNATLHPSLQRAYKLLLPYFDSLISEHPFLLNYKNIEHWIPKRYQAQFFTKAKQEEKKDQANPRLDPSSSEKDSSNQNLLTWMHFKRTVQWIQNTTVLHTEKEKQDFAELSLFLPRIVLTMLYPRLDANVSTQMNHLLKLPFSVHPETGNICLPIDPSKIKEFDPIQHAPSLDRLDKDLNKKATAESSKDIPFLTCLENSLSYFNQLMSSQYSITDLEDLVNL